MASKLDEEIARVTIAVAGNDADEMIAAAAAAAGRISTADLAKFPDRWYPKVTSKSAGAPQFRDSWPRAWFEALTEILFHKGRDGLPILLELMKRDDSTYHEMVLPRLLRLASAEIEKEQILDFLRTRLGQIHQTHAYASTREVVWWSRRDSGPLELLKSLASLEVRNAEGDTIGSQIEHFGEELGEVVARENPQTSTDAIDEYIVTVAVADSTESTEELRVLLSQASTRIDPKNASSLFERLERPDLPTLKSRLPGHVSRPEYAWSSAVLNIACRLGEPAADFLLSALDNEDEHIGFQSLRTLFLFAAINPGEIRKKVVTRLKKVLPKLFAAEVRSTILDVGREMASELRLREVFDAMADVSIGSSQLKVADVVASIQPPPPDRPVDQDLEAACQSLANRFGEAVVAGDFDAAAACFSADLKKKYTATKLKSHLKKNWSHSGPPDMFEYFSNDTPFSEVVDGGGGFSKLPKYFHQDNFRMWCSITFLPLEDSEADTCFDLWLTLMEEGGELKIGFFEILDSD